MDVYATDILGQRSSNLRLVPLGRIALAPLAACLPVLNSSCVTYPHTLLQLAFKNQPSHPICLYTECRATSPFVDRPP